MKPYGPYIIEQSLIWLPHYLSAEQARRYGYPPVKLTDSEQREFDKLAAFKRAADEVLSRAFKFSFGEGVPTPTLITHSKDLVQFKPGGDPIFNLKPDEPARTAVTGSDLADPVTFNLGLISNPEQFTYGDALALWTHEIGHKVKIAMPSLTQQEIDELGAQVGRIYGRAAKIHEWDAWKFLTIAPVPVIREGQMMWPFSALPMRVPSTFAVVQDGKFIDLSREFDRALDSAIRPGYNYIEKERRILNFQKLKDTTAGAQFLIELRTVRTPKNMNAYLSSDMGNNYFRVGVVEISKDLNSIQVLSYQEQPAPTELITDADAELLSPGISTDKTKVTGVVRFYMKNETHFHALSYPTASFVLLGLLDGRPIRIESDAAIRVTKEVGSMPNEIHKKPTMTEGRFSFELNGLEGEVLELTGIESRFFTLGQVTYPEDERKRIRVRESL
ncbi:MAG: hypothetical protein ACXWQE_11095, partial [Bdellovibrionales bacterium]